MRAPWRLAESKRFRLPPVGTSVAAGPAPARASTVRRPRFLVISPTPTHPEGAGNRQRVARLLRDLERAGHDFRFLFLKGESRSAEDMRARWGPRFVELDHRPEWRRMTEPSLRRRGQIPLDAWYDRRLDAHIAALRDEFDPDVVVVEYAAYSRALLLFDASVLKVVDAHDVFTNRAEQAYERGDLVKWYTASAEEERRALDRADLVLAITARDRGQFEALGLARARVFTLGHAPEGRPAAAFSRAKRLGFVGSANPQNEGALSFLLDELMPRLLRCDPRFELCVAGTIADRVPEGSTGVRRLGFVASLDAFYSRVGVALNPVRLGTGLAIKTVEALAYGMPTVTTTTGARGLLPWSGRALLIGDSADDFAAQVLRLASDRGLYERLSRQASAASRSYARECEEAVNNLLHAAHRAASKRR